MSGSDFTDEWLRLRAPYDAVATARGPAALLAAAFGRTLRRGRERAVLRLYDLGGGNGANVARLAPRIPGSQRWTIVDSDAGLLDGVGETIETWARSIGGRFARSGEAMTVTTPQRVVTVETLDGDLRDGLAALPLDDADGVAASALLDLVADDWLTAAAATLAERGLPALFSLTVDGRLGWTPGAAEDSAIAAAFARDLRRDKGFGRAVGADAPAVAAQVLAAAGYRVETAPSDWRIAAAAEDTAMHRALLSFIVPAVRAQPPEGTNVAAWSALLDAWEGEKRSLVDAAGLDLTVGHTDLLAVT